MYIYVASQRQHRNNDNNNPAKVDESESNNKYAKVWNGNSSVNDCQSQFMWISASPSKWYQSFYSHWSASESIQKRDTRKGLPLPLCVLVRRMKRIFQGEKRKKKISSSGLVVAGLACTPALLLFFLRSSFMAARLVLEIQIVEQMRPTRLWIQRICNLVTILVEIFCLSEQSISNEHQLQVSESSKIYFPESQHTFATCGQGETLSFKKRFLEHVQQNRLNMCDNKKLRDMFATIMNLNMLPDLLQHQRSNAGCRQITLLRRGGIFRMKYNKVNVWSQLHRGGETRTGASRLCWNFPSRKRGMLELRPRPWWIN